MNIVTGKGYSPNPIQQTKLSEKIYNQHEGENTIGNNKQCQMFDAVNACYWELTQFQIEAELSSGKERCCDKLS
jgi:hypothetical protein